MLVRVRRSDSGSCWSPVAEPAGDLLLVIATKMGMIVRPLYIGEVGGRDDAQQAVAM
jgi:hypothetical protein